MSLIVGFVEESGIWMGSESYIGAYDVHWPVDHPKVALHFVKESDDQRIKAVEEKRPRQMPVLVGVVGANPEGELLGAGWELPQGIPEDTSEATREWVARDLVLSMHERCRSVGALKTSEGMNSIEAEMLIGVRGQLFWVTGSGGLTKHVAWAVGSAWQHALGALGALHRSMWNFSDPAREWNHCGQARLYRVLEAASQFHQNVKPPFHFVHLGRDGSVFGPCDLKRDVLSERVGEQFVGGGQTGDRGT